LRGDNLGIPDDDDFSPVDYGVSFLKKMETASWLKEHRPWNEKNVVRVVNDVVVYRSLDTFPSHFFYDEYELKKARSKKKIGSMTVTQLRVECKRLELSGYSNQNRADLVKRLIVEEKGINGVIYVDSKKRVERPQWKPTQKILLLHDDSGDVNQPGGGRLRYGTADVKVLNDIAVDSQDPERNKDLRGFLKNHGFIQSDVIDDYTELPALLMENRYDIVLISGHGDRYGLSGRTFRTGISKEVLHKSLKNGKGVGYLFISACQKAGDGSWKPDEDDEDGWGDDGLTEDYAISLIRDCEIRALTISGRRVPADSENSLFLVKMLMKIMEGSLFSEVVSYVGKHHPKEGYNDLPMHYTHVGDPTFKLSMDGN